MRILLLVCLMVGVAQAETPTQIAKKIVTAQIEALADNNDLSGEAFAKTFATDAVVMASYGGTAKNELGGIQSEIRGGMHAWVQSAKLVSLVAGGDDKVVWISAEIDLANTSHTGPGVKTKESYTLRVTELAVSDGGKWKVVAAMFGRPGPASRNKYPPLAIEGTTKRGSMTKFLVDPKQVAFQLPGKDDTVVVFGTDKSEKAVGAAAAKKLLESWKGLKLEIEGNVREVEGPTWGFVQANISWVKPGGPPYRLCALMIATKEPSQPWVFRAIQFAND